MLNIYALHNISIYKSIFTSIWNIFNIRSASKKSNILIPSRRATNVKVSSRSIILLGYTVKPQVYLYFLSYAISSSIIPFSSYNWMNFSPTNYSQNSFLSNWFNSSCIAHTQYSSYSTSLRNFGSSWERKTKLEQALQRDDQIITAFYNSLITWFVGWSLMILVSHERSWWLSLDFGVSPPFPSFEAFYGKLCTRFTILKQSIRFITYKMRKFFNN